MTIAALIRTPFTPPPSATYALGMIAWGRRMWSDAMAAAIAARLCGDRSAALVALDGAAFARGFLGEALHLRRLEVGR